MGNVKGISEVGAAGSQIKQGKAIVDCTAIELVLMWLAHPNERDWAYEIACFSQDLMFETGYLWSVTGKPPYRWAQKFGLTDANIESYKQMWRDAGVNPEEVEHN